MKKWDGRPIPTPRRGTITYGALAVNAVTTGSVTFASPFGAVPEVTVTVTSSRVIVAIHDVTTTGFNWTAANWSPAVVGSGYTARWSASL